MPRQGVAAFFVYSLDEQPLHQFMRGQWPDWSSAPVAVAEFSLRGKRDRQVWERERPAQWYCLNLPLDLDDATAESMNFDDFRRWKT